MTNLDRIFKSRDITLPTKVHLVKAMVFPVVMYGCESWTMKKAEHRRIDAFELWCWRRLLRVHWTARRSVLGIHWKDWCWSWNSNTLATSCEELTHWKSPWCWEGLEAEGEGDDRGQDNHYWLNGHEFDQALGDGEGQGSLACGSPWVMKSWIRLSDWTTTLITYEKSFAV